MLLSEFFAFFSPFSRDIFSVCLMGNSFDESAKMDVGASVGRLCVSELYSDGKRQASRLESEAIWQPWLAVGKKTGDKLHAGSTMNALSYCTTSFSLSLFLSVNTGWKKVN